ncbi:MAG: DUF4287 domain-containing protein [Microbacterium sp.]
MQHWLDIAAERLHSGHSHLAVVALLKIEHGHGHANAIAGYTRATLTA